MSELKYETLHYEVMQQIAKITLDRPPANLINLKMTQEYHAALQRADMDPNVRVIILSGAGDGLSGQSDPAIPGRGTAPCCIALPYGNPTRIRQRY